MNKQLSWGWLAGLAVCVLVLAGCDKVELDPVAQRAATANKRFQAGLDIPITVVWSESKGGFLEGATMAVEEINAAGGVKGRPLRLKYVDEAKFLKTWRVDRSTHEGRYRNAVQDASTNLAKHVAEDPEVTAVFGHTNDMESTLSALLAYQAHGMLFINGGSAGSSAMQVGDELYFQMLPAESVLVKKITDELQRQRWGTVSVVYLQSARNSEVVEMLKTEMAGRGMSIHGSIALLADADKTTALLKGHLQELLPEFRDGKIDAIILLMPGDMGAQVIRQARVFGIRQPFVGTDLTAGGGVNRFIETVGDAGLGTIVTHFFNSKSYLAARFAKKYFQRYPNKKFNEWATIGYDSVRLYADAVACANSTDPTVVSSAIHYKIPLWYGVLGPYSFTQGVNTRMKFYTLELSRGKDSSLGFQIIGDRS